MKHIILSIVIAVSLIGCATGNSKPADVVINDFVIIDPEKAPTPELDNIHFRAWNRDKLYEESQKAENKDSVFFVLTREELDKLFKNLINVSDTLSKSIKNNSYYQDAINAYRKDKEVK